MKYRADNTPMNRRNLLKSALAAFPLMPAANAQEVNRWQSSQTMMLNRAAFVLLVACYGYAFPVCGAGDYYPPPDSEGGWRSLINQNAGNFRKVAGMDRAKLDEAFQLAQETTQHGGLIVVRHGYLVFEKYFGRAARDSNPDMASCGKAFTSIACGIMLKEKHDLIPQGLDTKVFTKQYLPEAFPLDDPEKAEITLGELLAMTAGFHGEANKQGYKNGKEVKLEPVPQDRSLGLDMGAIRYPLWCKPGEGWSYSSPSPHIASIVLRHLVGMDLKDYIEEKLGKPMQWGAWNYCLYRGNVTLPHANGAGSIALHATDTLRFGYLLLHHGLWRNQQLVPAEYVAMCSRPSPLQSPLSFQSRVRSESGRSCCRCAARLLLEVGRRRLRNLYRAFARPGHLQTRRKRCSIQSSSHALTPTGR